MNNKSFVALAVLLLLACARIAISQQSKVPPEVWEKAKTKGVVRVLVGLNVPTKPLGTLSQDARLAQQQAIAAAQDTLLAELAGTTYRVTGRFKYSAGLGLEVGPDALAVLERSPLVIKVIEDRPEKSHLEQSVPLVEADQAWAAGFDGTGWVVAILDTGVDKDHPFLTGSVLAEACFSGGVDVGFFLPNKSTCGSKRQLTSH